MTILIIASHAGSLRIFRGALIEALLSKGLGVHAAAPGLVAGDATFGWLRKRGVTCHDIALARTGLNPIADLRTLAGLVRLMRRLRPQIVLAYTIKPVIWGLLAARMAAVPKRVALITGLGYAFVGTARGKRARVRWLASRLYARALRQATLVVFQNPDDRDDLRNWGVLPAGVRSVLVKGSGVDTGAFSPAPFVDAPPRFLMIARLVGDKGVREYAQAAAWLRARNPQAGFHLVGPLDPSPDGIPEAEVRGWQEAGHLVWHGAAHDVRPDIAASHVYVLPSYREGMPRTVLEALAMGRPVITTDVPGCRETVRDGVNGFLVPARDVSALATAMERFICAPDRVARMGGEARRITVETFDVRQVNAAMLEAMDLT